MAHVAAIECELATGATPSPLIPFPAAWRPADRSGVAQRRGWTPPPSPTNFARRCRPGARSMPRTPTDPDACPRAPSATSPGTPAPQLRNRVVDMWVHDIWRAAAPVFCRRRSTRPGPT
ncbi:MAG: hypothetical protein IPH03_11605 [Tetrasphaera sp.]|nr:hypothetical protein [Tetrasphaera sp.]